MTQPKDPREQSPGYGSPRSYVNMELLERLEKKVNAMDKELSEKLTRIQESMNDHVIASQPIYTRLAVVETKLATVTKILWGIGGGLVTVGAVVFVKLLDVI